MGQVRRLLGADGALSGHKLVVTAGGTREALDPVRYIGNRSSGKQGSAIAQAAIDAGAAVVLITAAALPPPIGATQVSVDTAEVMKAAVIEHVAESSALIMAAAVADYRPRAVSARKIKKSDEALSLPLERTADILRAVKARRQETGYPKIVVGFAAESENLLENRPRQAPIQGAGPDRRQ